MRTLLNAAFEGKERENFEFPLFSKAQMTRSAGKSACRSENIVLNATTLRGPDGEVIGVICVGQGLETLFADADQTAAKVHTALAEVQTFVAKKMVEVARFTEGPARTVIGTG